MAPSVLWFRRDLRLADHPALDAARRASGADGVYGCFVLDDELLTRSGPARAQFLAACLERLDDDMGGRLVLRSGRPEEVVPALAAEVGAEAVFVTGDTAPYGTARDARVDGALGRDGRRLERVGTPYAVDPGSVAKSSGEPYRVFTPFRRAWEALGWPPPLPAPEQVDWRGARSNANPGGIVARSGSRRPRFWEDLPADAPASMPAPGEEGAHAALERFVDGGLGDYAEARNLVGQEGSSRLSPYLRFGCIHPRQVLSSIAGAEKATKDTDVFRSELAWREFYADVLFHQPESARSTFGPGLVHLRWDEGPVAEDRFRRWALGQTGVPLVDAGMRQLLAEGWVHNRARMVAASFLVKDLHLDWRWGARWFMYRLVDGDLASNQHGWQWTAGTGTDAAPFHRIFNPFLQAERFDPDGAYVRRYVAELDGMATKDLHAPGGPVAPGQLAFDGASGYPEPIVDHGRERQEALARFEAARTRGER